jgi:anti-anti-sigma factor
VLGALRDRSEQRCALAFLQFRVRGSTRGEPGSVTSSGESSGQTGLRIDVAREEDTCTIRLGGELDLSNSAQLDAALLEAEASDASRIVLDVDELRFIDSTGLRVILRATRRAERTRGRLRVTRGKGYVADMFRLTALDRTIPFA